MKKLLTTIMLALMVVALTVGTSILVHHTLVRAGASDDGAWCAGVILAMVMCIVSGVSSAAHLYPGAFK